MRQMLAPLDQLIRADLSKKEEDAVLSCDPQENVKEMFSGCTSSLLSYKPVPTSSLPEDDAHLTYDSPIPGERYPYPTTISITPVPNPLLKLSMCLVERKHLTAGEMSKKMGCELAKSSQKSDNE